MSTHSMDSVKGEFHLLLENLDGVLKRNRPRTKILSTRLGKLQKELESFHDRDRASQAKIADMVMKYNFINKLFGSKIEYKEEDLVKVIEGSLDFSEDSNERYNDTIFELSMGIRFLLSQGGDNHRINLRGTCDVVINDSIAIECKCIHSAANMLKNIKKANEQINQRVADKEAKCGFIALDLSNIFPRDKVLIFAERTFNRFARNYEHLQNLGREFADPLGGVLKDKNLHNIISGAIMHEVETTFHSEVREPYGMGPNTLAIIIQSSNTFCFARNGQAAPMPTRGMTYVFNPGLSSELKLKVKQMLHNLAVGI
jgi:hypothetical protein